MRRIVLLDDDFAPLRAHLLKGPTEEAAVCIGGHVSTSRVEAILVREVHPVPPEALITRSGTFVEIDAVWLAALIKRARGEGLSMIVCHSHPFSTRQVGFSGTDTAGQAALIPKLQARIPNVPHAEMVFGQESVDALLWSPNQNTASPVECLRLIGERLEDLPTSRWTPRSAAVQPGERYTRQSFLGPNAQERLASLSVGIVGLGGNGSPMSAQLAHVGVGDLLLVDPDRVDESNLNRLIAASPADVGQAKVDIAERYAKSVSPGSSIRTIAASVEESWEQLRDCDLIVGCTDNLASRLLLDRLAAQYLIPFLDTATEIETAEVGLRTTATRVTLVRPQGPCLEELGITSEDAYKSEHEAGRRPGYVAEDPAASVIGANLLVAGMAGIEFLKLVFGLLGGSPMDRYFAYSARSGEVRACAAREGVTPNCEERRALGDATGPPVTGITGTQAQTA